jgi:hypothetical protein
MRNATLHDLLEAFTADAADRLAAATRSGEEIPFELITTPGRARRSPLYCYRPLTGAFIREHETLLAGLPTYAPAARALAEQDGIEAYLGERAEPRIPADPRERADAALRALLGSVFEERSEFGFDPARFESAYSELERWLYEGYSVSVVVTPLFGVALDPVTERLEIGDGVALVRGDELPDAPAEAVWADGDEPTVLAVLTVVGDTARAPTSIARSRFRRLLTALRLFERGGYALGPLAWTRHDEGAWRQVASAGVGRARLRTVIAADHEDELRAFCNLVGKRVPSSGGEVAWALARFEMGCDRLSPFEALTDYLMALRALLEPEGPQSGRLAQRLAVICATEDQRPALAERTAHAISLERAVIAGLAPAEPGVDALVDELAEHLRAILRDVVCGHLGADLCGVADELLTEAAAAGA